MRKLIVTALMAVTLLPAVPAAAQSHGEVRHDRRELQQQQRDLRQAKRYGGAHAVRRERQDVRGVRRELRQDQRDYRRHSRYVAPVRGWTYRAVRPGYRLQSSFYGTRYGISGRYAGAGLRWVRYGDDALLVNVRTGRVVRVMSRYF